MHALDRVFLALYSRQRRMADDANLESAWTNAGLLMSMLIALPLMAIEASLIGLFQLVTHIDIDSEIKGVWLIFGALIGLQTSVLVHRAFDRYLAAPPLLPVNESSEGQSLTRWFVSLSVLAFAVGCLGALVLLGAKPSS